VEDAPTWKMDKRGMMISTWCVSFQFLSIGGGSYIMLTTNLSDDFVRFQFVSIFVGGFFGANRLEQKYYIIRKKQPCRVK